MKSLFLLPLALLTSSALATPDLNERQAASITSSNTSHASNTITTSPTPLPTPLSPSQFSAQALGLIANFIPQSLLPGLGVAIENAVSTTGDINSIVTSALIAPTPPPFLSALPSQYSPYIASLEAQLSSLRAIGQGQVPGQARVTTETFANGTVAVTTLAGVLTQTRSNGSLVTSTLPLSGPGEVVVLTVTNSAGSTYYTGSTVTSTSTTSTPPAVTVSSNQRARRGAGAGAAEPNLLGCVDSRGDDNGGDEFEKRPGGPRARADCNGRGDCGVRWLACCFLNELGICETHPLFMDTRDGGGLVMFGPVWTSCLSAARHYTWALS